MCDLYFGDGTCACGYVDSTGGHTWDYDYHQPYYPPYTTYTWPGGCDLEAIRKIIREELKGMAIVHLCDKCGNEIRSYSEVDNRAVIPFASQSALREEFDLCKNCIAQLRHLLGTDLVERIPED